MDKGLRVENRLGILLNPLTGQSGFREGPVACSESWIKFEGSNFAFVFVGNLLYEHKLLYCLITLAITFH